MDPAHASARERGTGSSPAPTRETANRHESTARLRRMTLGALALVLVQAGIGMDVNLFAAIPARHPGAQASDYFTGSFHSVAWAIDHGAIALAIHASLGLALAVMAISVAVIAVRLRAWSLGTWAVLAGLLVIGAGFNGASFLDYNKDVSSLIMALLALGAVACYALVLYLLAVPARNQA